MKTKIAGNMAIISTKLTKNEIKGLERHNPDALVLKDEAGNTTFKVTAGCTSFNKNGISFSEADAESGKMFVTLPIPEKTVDKAAYIADNFGKILTDLMFVEEYAEEAFAEVTENLASIAEAIEVVEIV